MFTHRWKNRNSERVSNLSSSTQTVGTNTSAKLQGFLLIYVLNTWSIYLGSLQMVSSGIEKVLHGQGDGFGCYKIVHSNVHNRQANMF